MSIADHVGYQQFEDGEVQVWAELHGAIILKAVAPNGDPVELSSDTAREIGQALIRLAESYG